MTIFPDFEKQLVELASAAAGRERQRRGPRPHRWRPVGLGALTVAVSTLVVLGVIAIILLNLHGAAASRHGGATGGAGPALAQRTSPSNAAISDCLAHPGGLTGHYTVGQLRHALQVMPAETKEYTSCPDVINRALLAAISTPGKTGGATGGGSGSFLPTPVIVVLVLLMLGAITFAAISIRRR